MSLVRPCLLVVALLLAGGCGSSGEFLIPAGAQVAVLGGVGLRAEVTRIVNTRSRLKVFVQLENQGADELRFKRAMVSLEHLGRRHEARDLVVWESDVDLLPGQLKSMSWGFHLDQLAEPGTYELTIAGVHTLDGEVLQPVGRDLVLPVTLPD